MVEIYVSGGSIPELAATPHHLDGRSGMPPQTGFDRERPGRAVGICEPP
jgi:hypothetical protein